MDLSRTRTVWGKKEKNILFKAEISFGKVSRVGPLCYNKEQHPQVNKMLENETSVKLCLGDKTPALGIFSVSMELMQR